MLGSPYCPLPEVQHLHMVLEVVLILKGLLAARALVLVHVLAIVEGHDLVSDESEVYLVEGTGLSEGHLVSRVNGEDLLIQTI